MKFTLSWLKEHLQTDASVQEIADRLSMLGLECEGITDHAHCLREFVVAHVVQAVQHPDADRLRVCKVDAGTGSLIQVVCGAPNARAGMKGIFARDGAYIPGADITLKHSKIRGVDSCGMLLSEREMDISDEHDCIVDLPEDTAIGMAAADALGLNDPIIEIALTPNRGDCLGVRGIARDLAGAGMGTLKPLSISPVAGTFECPVDVHLECEPQEACPYFIGRVVRGVNNAPSPAWLQQRLLAIGLRPISALVDITNYMTFALNRPLHVFDADKITGDLRVRSALGGESFEGLNGVTYTLKSGMTIIADDNNPEALGGVMGGAASACTDTTTNVFIESAYFDPVRTAITGRELDILSDARYRFERGIDPAFTADGLELATQMMLDLCGGAASDVVIAGTCPTHTRTITLRPQRMGSFGGMDVSAHDCVQIMERLGFGVDTHKDILTVSPPSWRSDIVDEQCLIEEVVRIKGYDTITPVPLVNTTPTHDSVVPFMGRRRSRARRAAVSAGLCEALTYSFISAEQAALFGGAGDDLALTNPISTELSHMRPSLLPSLMAAAARNRDKSGLDSAIFEVGPVYHDATPDGQIQMLAGIRTGMTGPRHWAAPSRVVDLWDARADAEHILSALNFPIDKLTLTRDAPAYYHPGRSAVLGLGPKNMIARFGDVHPTVVETMGLKGTVVAFEVLYEALPVPKKSAARATRTALELPDLQPLRRDFAFMVDANIDSGTLVAAVRTAERKLIDGVQVFDVFDAVEDGKKSIALSVHLQPRAHVLTEQDIDIICDAIIEKVKHATGGQLRT